MVKALLYAVGRRPFHSCRSADQPESEVGAGRTKNPAPSSFSTKEAENKRIGAHLPAKRADLQLKASQKRAPGSARRGDRGERPGALFYENRGERKHAKTTPGLVENFTRRSNKKYFLSFGPDGPAALYPQKRQRKPLIMTAQLLPGKSTFMSHSSILSGTSSTLPKRALRAGNASTPTGGEAAARSLRQLPLQNSPGHLFLMAKGSVAPSAQTSPEFNKLSGRKQTGINTVSIKSGQGNKFKPRRKIRFFRRHFLCRFRQFAGGNKEALPSMS